MDLADRRLAGGEEGLDQGEDLDRIAEPVVRRRVLLEHVDEPVAVVDVEQQLLRVDLLARLAEEVLLARRADEVGVLVAVADVLERVVAAEALVAGLDVDLRVLVERRRGERVVVEVVAVDVEVDAVDRVDGVGEPVEVDVDDVVDVEVGELP